MRTEFMMPVFRRRAVGGWRVFFIGAEFGDAPFGSTNGRIIDWTSTRLFAVWPENAHGQLRIVHSDDDGETWTHERGTIYNCPWAGGFSYNGYAAGDPVESWAGGNAMLAFSSGRVGSYIRVNQIWEDQLGHLTEPARIVHRAIWSPTPFGSRPAVPVTTNWSLRRFYSGPTGSGVSVSPARAYDHSRYGLLIRESRITAPFYVLLYNDLDANGDFPGTPVGDNPAGIETVRESSSTISAFKLTFVGSQPKAIWTEAGETGPVTYYKQRTESGWPASPTVVSNPNAVENYLIVNHSLNALDDNLALYGLVWLSADNPGKAYPTDFIFRDRRGPGEWTDMAMVDMRATKGSPSTALADSPAAWVSSGVHQTSYPGLLPGSSHACAAWLKNRRFLFVLLQTSHGVLAGTHGALVSQGADPNYDGEAFIENPEIEDDMYSIEQQWLLRLDLGSRASGGGFIDI